MSMDMMHMTFYYTIDGTILFNGWKVTNYTEFWATFFVLIFLGILYEFTKNFRYSLQDCQPCNNSNDQENSSFISKNLSKEHLIDTLLFTIQIILSYVLMLVVMTYNLWYFIAIIIGALIGHIIFGKMASKQNSNKENHCGP